MGYYIDKDNSNTAFLNAVSRVEKTDVIVNTFGNSTEISLIYFPSGESKCPRQMWKYALLKAHFDQARRRRVWNAYWVQKDTEAGGDVYHAVGTDLPITLAVVQKTGGYTCRRLLNELPELVTST